MGRAELIGDGRNQLIPAQQPDELRDYQAPRRKNSSRAHQRRTKGRKVITQHTGLPPRGGR
jgi:hypothetical protein